MHKPNAVVEPYAVQIRLLQEPSSKQVSVHMTAQCQVRLQNTRPGSEPLVVDLSVDADPELRAQVELLYSILKRRVGLTMGEG